MKKSLKFLFITLFSTLLLVILYFTIQIYTIKKNKSKIQNSTGGQIETTTLHFDTLKYDITEIKQDTTISYDFTVKNTGNHSLFIYSVNPSCLCTDYFVSKRIILPADTAKITLTLDTKGKVGFYDIGAIVIANTEDKYYRLRLTGVIKK